MENTDTIGSEILDTKIEYQQFLSQSSKIKHNPAQKGLNARF